MAESARKMEFEVVTALLNKEGGGDPLRARAATMELVNCRAAA